MNFHCESTNHKKKQIILFCLNDNCQQNKLLCDICLQQNLHPGHHKDLVKQKNMNDFLLKRSQESEKFIQFMQIQIDSSQELLNKIKVGLRQKYQINEERIKQFNNQQLSQAIQEIVQFQKKKQQIEQQFMGGILKLNTTFENIYTKMELDSLAYRGLSDIEKQKAKDLFGEGYNLYWPNKQYEQAILKLDESLNINSFDAVTLWCKGDCLRQLGRNNEALPLFDKALEIDPKHVNTLFSKGGCLRQLGKYNEALAFLDKVLKINPKHINSLYNKGECLRMLEKYDEAVICLDKALEINPNHIYSQSCKGACLCSQKKYNDALSYVEKVLEIDPNYSQAIGSKAHTLKGLNRYEEALEFYEKAISFNPNWSSYLVGKKFCQEQLGIKQ